MCFLDHSFGHIFFVFFFVAKPMLEFRENMMFFRIVLKSRNYNYLSRRKVLFSRYRKWWRSIVGQAAKATYIFWYAIIFLVFASRTVAELLFEQYWPRVRWCPMKIYLHVQLLEFLLNSCTLQSAIFLTNGSIHSIIWIYEFRIYWVELTWSADRESREFCGNLWNIAHWQGMKEQRNYVLKILGELWL